MTSTVHQESGFCALRPAVALLLSCLAAAGALGQAQPAGPSFFVGAGPETVADPEVAVDADGNFLVAWHMFLSSCRVATIYDRQGAFLNSFVVSGSEFVAPQADAAFLAPGGRRYNAAGLPVAGDFQVNGHATDDQRRPSVAALPGGGFVVVWDSDWSAGSDDDFSSIQMRWLDANGQPTGPDFQVNELITGYQTSPDVAMTSDGFVEVLWRGPDAQRRTYGLDGVPVTGQQTISDNPSGASAPDLGTGPDGGFVVAWPNGGYPGAIYARRFVSPLFSDGFESGDTSAWALTVP